MYLLYTVELTTILGGSIKRYWNARNESHFKHRFTVQSFASHGGYMVMTILMYNIYGVLCGSDILYTHTRSVIWCFSGQFLQACLNMLVASASGENFNPFRRTTLIAWGLMSVNIVSFAYSGLPLINE